MTSGDPNLRAASAPPADAQVDLPRCLARASLMATRAVTRAYNAFLREAGLPVTQFSLLSTIKLGSYASLSDVAGSLALERTTLLRNLAQLEAAGLVVPVERGTAGTGRGKRYRLTPEGEAAFDQARPLWLQAQQAFTSALGPEDAAEIGRTLTRLRRTAEALASTDHSPASARPRTPKGSKP